MAEDVELATVELVGALTYGQLRAFEVTARAIAHAPDVRRADRVATFAVREHAGYRALRDHLDELTDLSAGVMDRQKPRFDDYFDNAPMNDWVSSCSFLAVGLPLAGDFIREVAPTLPPATREVVVGALADRGSFERFALDEVTAALEADPGRRGDIKHLTADIVGRALTGFQGAVGETDALKVLLEAGLDQGPSGERLVKQVAVAVLEAHRRRMHALGLEELL